MFVLKKNHNNFFFFVGYSGICYGNMFGQSDTGNIHSGIFSCPDGELWSPVTGIVPVKYRLTKWEILSRNL